MTHTKVAAPQHPALKNAPKTPQEACKRLLKAYKAGKLQPRGNCKYLDEDGKPCAIGLFLTKEQATGPWVKGDYTNKEAGIDTLAARVGKDNIEIMTGMPLGMCTDIQQAFDQADTDFVSEIEYCLNEYEQGRYA